MTNCFYVYILTNKGNRVLYTGVTRNLIGRVHQHRVKAVEGFTAKYKVTKLVYFECYPGPMEAIVREKQIKGGSRETKIRMIESKNPEWEDLYPEIASL